MAKTYKVTYKPYFNERIKPVRFHGKDVHPLYMQVTFDRKSIFFKSYYFDLFSRPKYAELETSIEQIKEQESRLIEYIVDKNTDAFSLEEFAKEYKYLATDLLEPMDERFKDYLVDFFMDEGIPRYAGIVRAIYDSLTAMQIVDTFKTSFKPELYDKMIEHAIYYAPPYIPLVDFIRQQRPNGLISFPVFEWKQPGTAATLEKFLATSFPEYKISEVKKSIERYIERI
ncbi:hypothetical protein [Chitinophaga arvensicola]|uniref:Uncharacterized protein n=1 Tax=Chitinophaga arvensicola TaxID=29529 RepID=A0A1I0QJQ9_9BACT|nr:hypothetical protein [Chitinophaga arvensicola]SEW27263.1 hypothetical protein SAMN04488122_1516 [Chitinophaga arvensicola]